MRSLISEPVIDLLKRFLGRVSLDFNQLLEKLQPNLAGVVADAVKRNRKVNQLRSGARYPCLDVPEFVTPGLDQSLGDLRHEESVMGEKCLEAIHHERRVDLRSPFKVGLDGSEQRDPARIGRDLVYEPEHVEKVVPGYAAYLGDYANEQLRRALPILKIWKQVDGGIDGSKSCRVRTWSKDNLLQQWFRPGQLRLQERDQGRQFAGKLLEILVAGGGPLLQVRMHEIRMPPVKVGEQNGELRSPQQSRVAFEDGVQEPLKRFLIGRLKVAEPMKDGPPYLLVFSALAGSRQYGQDAVVLPCQQQGLPDLTR